MCNLSKGVWEKGFAIGMEKGYAEGWTLSILDCIRSVVENIGISVEQAMAALEIPDNEKQKYKDLLEKQ